MIYSFHHFYYWLKGGVESGMAYRAKIFRELGLDAKFVFTTAFRNADIQHETGFLGFLDSEVIWLYGFFTDCKISPVTYTLERFERSFCEEDHTFSREGDRIRYTFPERDHGYLVYLAEGKEDCVHRVELIADNGLIRKDYYTYCRVYSEYYMPVDGQTRLYLRRFFDEDGTVSYEEVMRDETQADDVVLYKFPDRLVYSREELVGYMMACMKLTSDDVVLIDGEPGKIEMAAFIQNASPARVGLILHADHYLNSDEENIQWYGIYEYAFAHPEKIDLFVTSTQAQGRLLQEQLKRYKGVEARVETIPVMGLEELKISGKTRRKHSLISVGRLAPEKRMDWVIDAVVEAKKSVPDLSLDIYGEGGRKKQLQQQIDELGCGDYVRLCGFQKLDEIYQNYDAYLSASWVETFGVTYLEAVGSGLPIIGFDIPYGAQVFINEAGNTKKPRYYNEIPIPEDWSINAGVDEGYGRITYRHEEKGRIYYTGSGKKYVVKTVEWYDRKGDPRFLDHYNRYGDICARTVCDHKGKPISKSWLSVKGEEVIVEDHVTGSIILNYRDTVKLFRDKRDMFIYFFRKLGLAQNRIFFNSLSTPFFISNALDEAAGKDVLFWQEPVGEGIPGNMQVILNGQAGRTDKIMVQKKSSYDRLIALGAKKEALSELGFIYPFKKENQHKREALICTNTDAIEHCRKLIESLGQVHFHIAAITEMSPRLMHLQDHKNVSLYPGAGPKVLDGLFQRCDYYFDINHYGEIVSAVRNAFLHDHLIFAFEETLHNGDYVADEHIYPAAEVERMIADIRAVLEDPAVLEQHLERQRRHALSESAETYRRIVNI